ncbi:VanZ family protein [Marinobacter fonticola]|uniref:VanZ family protein n=1 Tax=Marinobacter fonticola TaxID=2603215 RepID=UPI001D0D8841|nr:VanZ family protein [Marinobacter fonticola]
MTGHRTNTLGTMTELLRRLTQWTPAWRLALVASMALILWLSTAELTHPVATSTWDKANHTLAFIELMLLARLGWPRLPVLHSGLLILAFGALIELIQAPIPYRSASLLDLVADAIGIGLGLMLWWFILRPLQAIRQSD